MIDALKVLLLTVVLLLTSVVAVTSVPEDLEGELAARSFQVECATGEAALNPLGANGEEPRQEFLETIAEAEAFLCVDLPEITRPDGWLPRETNAMRSNGLDYFAPGEWAAAERGYKYAEIYYANAAERAFMSLIVHPDDLSERQGISVVCGHPPYQGAEKEEEDVNVRGISTTLWITESPSQGQSSASICWQERGLSFFVGVSYRSGFDVEKEVLPLLQSIE